MKVTSLHTHKRTHLPCTPQVTGHNNSVEGPTSVLGVLPPLSVSVWNEPAVMVKGRNASHSGSLHDTSFHVTAPTSCRPTEDGLKAFHLVWLVGLPCAMP
jgi:hypothetical protein